MPRAWARGSASDAPALHLLLQTRPIQDIVGSVHEPRNLLVAKAESATRVVSRRLRYTEHIAESTLRSEAVFSFLRLSNRIRNSLPHWDGSVCCRFLIKPDVPVDPCKRTVIFQDIFSSGFTHGLPQGIR